MRGRFVVAQSGTGRLMDWAGGQMTLILFYVASCWKTTLLNNVFMWNGLAAPLTRWLYGDAVDRV